MNYSPLTPFMFDPSASGITIFHPAAKPLFDQARRRASTHQMLAALMGRARQLRTLSEADRATIQFEMEPQACSLPIRQINGTLNRVQEFDCDFYPLSDSLETRWVRIASMMLHGTGLPPVELLHIGQDYFVVDGHHRISVSRMLNQNYVDAVIRNCVNPSAQVSESTG
ncbi:MAG TPA: hypothetical protein VHD90_17110 [Phototrophicaceae bacterium]|nr:hypothetical protein [Phototrophicaceae bacterium]